MEDRDGRRTREQRDRGGDREIDRRGGDPVLQRAEDREIAIRAWFRRQAGGELSREEREACKRVGLAPARRSLDLDLLADDEFESRQAEFRRAHHSLHEQRATMGTAAEGSTTIPVGFIRRLEEAMLAFGPMLQVATVLTTASGNDLHHPTVNDTDNEGSIVAENTSVDGSTEPDFGEIVFNAYKFQSKMVKVSSELLEDSAFNLARYLARALGERLGRGINRSMTTGTGTSQPNGIVTASALGVTATSTTAITADEVVTLAYSVDPAYRSGGRVGYMMHDNVALAIRLLKESTTNAYIWQPGLQLGQPDMLNGYRLYINQHMEGTPAAAKKLMLFGDLSKYMIRRVRGIRHRHLVERYADLDQEGFISYLRADGDLLDAGTKPIKHLITAAS